MTPDPDTPWHWCQRHSTYYTVDACPWCTQRPRPLAVVLAILGAFGLWAGLCLLATRLWRG